MWIKISILLLRGYRREFSKIFADERTGLRIRKGAAVLYVAGENVASLLKPSVIPGGLPKDTLIYRPLFALRILTG